MYKRQGYVGGVCGQGSQGEGHAAGAFTVVAAGEAGAGGGGPGGDNRI